MGLTDMSTCDIVSLNMSQVDIWRTEEAMNSFTGPVPRALAAFSTAILATSLALGSSEQPLKTIAHITVHPHLNRLH